MSKQTRNLIIIIPLALLAFWIALSPQAIELFGRTIEFHLGLDLVGGVQALMEADVPPDVPVEPSSMETARVIMENRANGLLGVGEATVQLAGDRRIVVELPGETDPEAALAVLGESGQLEFVEMGQITPQEALALEGTKIVTDYPVTPEDVPEGTKVYHTVMTGSALKNVGVQLDNLNQYTVAFELNDEGTKIFRDYTTAHTGDYLAIVLDKEVISIPVIKSPITDGSGSISGNFTQETANDLAIQLRYGSLPVPLKVVESRTVGPSLGEDSLRQSLIAGLIGLGLVMIFMVAYYRLPGLIADIALLFYVAITISLFKIIPVTLTLPGIAGFVLSIGVAVDANILIFERMKEELVKGRTLNQAIDLGWSRAWPSIRDSNFATLITTIILFWFGSAFGASMVKGFAVTLALGVLVSLFTAIIVTRALLHLVLDHIRIASHPRWFGVHFAPKSNLDIIGKRYYYFLISLIVIIPGLIALALWGLPLAIDFTGGSLVEIKFESGQAPPLEDVRAVYADFGYGDAEPRSSGTDTLIIRTKHMDNATNNRIVEDMSSQFDSEITILRFDSVGPTIGKEVATRAAGAVALASLAIMLYIWYAFRGVKNAHRYGVSAIIAMLHDVLVVFGVEAILAHFLGWEVDALFLVALLTVIGFSVHDSIVVFDRIRENEIHARRKPYKEIVNDSINQTMARSINTQFTVFLVLLALVLFGGSTIRHFVIIMMVGVMSGTYSSIFNASPILVVWNNREWKTWFHRKKKPAKA